MIKFLNRTYSHLKTSAKVRVFLLFDTVKSCWYQYRIHFNNTFVWTSVLEGKHLRLNNYIALHKLTN